MVLVTVKKGRKLQVVDIQKMTRCSILLLFPIASRQPIRLPPSLHRKPFVSFSTTSLDLVTQSPGKTVHTVEVESTGEA